nr:HAMP domain-containing sensor histidine kinase [uncultured Blautia sp.]
MKLSKKTFLYSILIAGILSGMLLLYFVCMLPSLYVAHKNDSNLESVTKLSREFMESRSYEGLQVDNPMNTISLILPDNENQVTLEGKGIHLQVETKDPELIGELDKVRKYLKDPEKIEEIGEDTFDLDMLTEKLFPKQQDTEEYPLQIQWNVDQLARKLTYRNLKVHAVSDNLTVYEATAKDEENQYVTYIALGSEDDSQILTLVSVIMPQMQDMSGVVFASVPMIVAVVFLVVLLASQYFSGKIVAPIIQLSRYASQIQDTGDRELVPFDVQRKDEIGELGTSLNQLYARLGENYRALESANRNLEKENKRQEVFMRASSHQLKTPVAAAMLLIDGMIDEVGKYADVKTYLPQVKGKLIEMRDIVNNVLYLNHCTEDLEEEPVELTALTGKIIEKYRIQIEKKELTVQDMGLSDGTGILQTDRELLSRILDNLISNAVSYTANGGKIQITYTKQGMKICNGEAHIPEELLPHVWEPFVSSNSEKKGKGLGLYISAYYAEVLHLKLTISNTADGVETSLEQEESVCC